MSFVNGTEIQTGTSFHFIVRKILEDCENTKQVIALIQKAKVSTANNFLIADRMGDIVVLESAPQKSIVRRPEKTNNLYILQTSLRRMRCKFTTVVELNGVRAGKGIMD